jgi:hypothetical protein
MYFSYRKTFHFGTQHVSGPGRIRASHSVEIDQQPRVVALEKRTKRQVRGIVDGGYGG